MALSNNRLEVSVSSVLNEDLAWADSCLIKDSDIPHGSSWSSFEQALLESLNPQTQPSIKELKMTVTSTISTDKPGVKTSNEPLTSEKSDPFLSRNLGFQSFAVEPFAEDVFRMGASQDMAITLATNKEDQKNSDYPLIKEEPDTSWSKIDLENVLLPTYDEKSREIQDSDSESDLGFSGCSSLESYTDDIFQVWDLNVPVEEYELIEQLNRALADDSSKPTASSSDDVSETLNALKNGSIDDLVSFIADLSLDQL